MRVLEIARVVVTVREIAIQVGTMVVVVIIIIIRLIVIIWTIITIVISNSTRNKGNGTMVFLSTNQKLKHNAE